MILQPCIGLSTNRIMISDSLRPYSQHTPEWNEDAEKIRNQEHRLGVQFEVSLNIPEAYRRGNRACCLNYP